MSLVAAAATIIMTKVFSRGLSMLVSSFIPMNSLCRHQIAKPERVAEHDFADGKAHWFPKVRSIEDKGMKFTVLAAGVHARGQVRQKALIDQSPGKRGIELRGIYANNDRLEPQLDEFPDELGGMSAPHRKQSYHVAARQQPFAIGSDILQEQITENDRVYTPFAVGREGLLHSLLMLIVARTRRDNYFLQPHSETLGLSLQ